MRLTKIVCDGAIARERDYTLWDDRIPGFGLRVHPTGRKTFIVKYRTLDGRQRKITLGRYGALTVDEARREAQKVTGAVATGGDPARVKQERRQAPTVKELADRFEREHIDVHLKPKTAGPYKWLLAEKILPAFGTLKVQAVTGQDVVRWHYGMKATPGNANRALSVLHKMFAVAAVWGWHEGPNPAAAAKRFSEKPRQRYLNGAELFRVGKAITDAEEGRPLPDATLDQAPPRPLSPYIALAFRLLLLTGRRRDEVLTLRWVAVDLEQGIITLEEHKTDARGAKVVVLSKAAVELLRRAPRQAGSPWVITGSGRSWEGEWRHVVNPSKAWAAVKKRASTHEDGLPDVDVTDVRLHDLRHSFASVAVGAGFSLPAIGALLGHADQQSTARYAHLDTDPMRLAADRIGGEIAALMNGQPPAEVFDLVAGREA